MRVSLRTYNRGSKANNFIKNTYYVSDNHINRVFYPIPEFVEDITCKCGQKGITMSDDYIVLCANCLAELLGNSTLQTKEEYKTPNIEDIFKKMRLQWSITGKDNWYTVSGRNVIPDSTRIVSPEELERLAHNFMIKILIGNTENITGDYDKDKKQMKIYF